jgi:diguanylate cyclase (GGDEF)-like protein
MAPVAALLVAFQPWLAGLDEPRFAGVVFVAFVAFQALARRLQPPVDRWFGRGFHRRADSVRLLVESLAHLGEPAALSERVLQTVALFEPQSAGVWVLSPGEGAFRRVGVLGDLACPATFPAHPPLAPAAGVFECDAGTRLGGLLPEGHGLALAVPLVAANRVVGLLGLGPRRTLQPYDSVEQGQLRTVGAAAAVALANALTFEQAIRDPLTGIYNRAFFGEVLQQELARAHREGRGFGLLFLDLDDFKRVNDTHGHPVGDALLVAASAQLRVATRASDVVARVGGDEFIVLIRGVSDAHGLEQARLKVEGAVGATAIEVSGGPLQIRATVGVAGYPADGPTEAALLQAADTNLYARKRARATA